MSSEYLSLVLDVVREIGEFEDNEELVNANVKTKLFGSQGSLDSFGLVNLLSEIEEKLSNDFGIDIALADEKAMSMTTSPFRNVESLAQYVEMLIKE